MVSRDVADHLWDSSAQITSTGSANAYVIAIAEQLGGYYQGMPPIRFKANFSCTGSATANIVTENAPSGLGAVTLKKQGGASNLALGDIVSGGVYTLIHDGTNFQVLELNAPLVADGVAAGLRWNFDSSTAMADPGTGDFRLNNASLGSVTALAISDLTAESGNPDASVWVLAWDDSTNTVRGTLVIRKRGAEQNFAVYNITGASADNSGWTQLALTYVTHSGSFSNGDACVLTFARAGDVGATGAAGTGGVTSVAIQVFAATGTYTPTSGMKYCIVEMVAPGGGGGGADGVGVSGSTSGNAGCAAGGGGYGEYARGVFAAAAIGASQAVTIGAVGAAGSNTGGNGGTGGTTSLGALLTAIGGTGGTGTGSNSTSSADRAGGAGGTGGTGGSFRIPGQAGGRGIIVFSDAFAATPLQVFEIRSGQGGDGCLGSGGASVNAFDTAGNAGANYGGGGSGAADNDTSGSAGGVGGAAIVIITEFIG